VNEACNTRSSDEISKADGASQLQSMKSPVTTANFLQRAAAAGRKRANGKKCSTKTPVHGDEGRKFEGAAPPSGAKMTGAVVYRFTAGFSNAVRRPVLSRDFF
jgi:hypothetical protein